MFFFHHIINCQNLLKTHTFLHYRSHRLRDINMLHSESKSKSRSTIFANDTFDGKCQNQQTSFCTFFIFAKVWPMQARSQDVGGEEARIWVPAQKVGPACHPRKIFEKRTCDLVHYITSVAQIINLASCK